MRPGRHPPRHHGAGARRARPGDRPGHRPAAHPAGGAAPVSAAPGGRHPPPAAPAHRTLAYPGSGHRDRRRRPALRSRRDGGPAGRAGHPGHARRRGAGPHRPGRGLARRGAAAGDVPARGGRHRRGGRRPGARRRRREGPDRPHAGCPVARDPGVPAHHVGAGPVLGRPVPGDHGPPRRRPDAARGRRVEPLRRPPRRRPGLVPLPTPLRRAATGRARPPARPDRCDASLPSGS